jgi:hypothetical protein
LIKGYGFKHSDREIKSIFEFSKMEKVDIVKIVTEELNNTNDIDSNLIWLLSSVITKNNITPNLINFIEADFKKNLETNNYLNETFLENYNNLIDVNSILSSHLITFLEEGRNDIIHTIIKYSY